MRLRAMIGLIFGAVAMLCIALIGSDADAQKRRTPYYASIAAGKARMRVGPGRSYPASWLYQRADLPIKVVAIFKEWRKIEDPDGTQGWMQANLLSDKRTAVVIGTPVDMLDSPRFGGKILWRAAPGVVGRISKCARGWCWYDVRGRAGYVEATHMWGVDPEEIFS